MTKSKEQTWRTMELVRAGVRDRSGDEFTPEALKHAVENFKGPVTVGYKFSPLTQDLQGEVETVSLSEDGNTIMADVKVYPTPAGLKVGKDFELALAGQIEMRDVISEPVDPLGADDVKPLYPKRTIKKFKITGAALVPPGEKVK